MSPLKPIVHKVMHTLHKEDDQEHQHLHLFNHHHDEIHDPHQNHHHHQHLHEPHHSHHHPHDHHHHPHPHHHHTGSTGENGESPEIVSSLAALSRGRSMSSPPIKHTDTFTNDNYQLPPTPTTPTTPSNSPVLPKQMSPTMSPSRLSQSRSIDHPHNTPASPYHAFPIDFDESEGVTVPVIYEPSD